MQAELAEAFEVLVEGEGTSPIVLCCEHASNARHGSWKEDSWLAQMHWAWDPGAAQMTRDLAKALGSRAVLARFSRLLIDANRPLDSPTLFRDVADGKSVVMNRDLSEEEQRARIARWWTPYHRALDRVAGAHPAQILLSIHSFTPVYEGQKREVEVGVLFESEDRLAAAMIEAIRPSGLDVRANEPYSGKGGMMFSCYKHARAHSLAALELEFRQDLLADPVQRASVLQCVLAGINRVVE